MKIGKNIDPTEIRDLLKWNWKERESVKEPFRNFVIVTVYGMYIF